MNWNKIFYGFLALAVLFVVALLLVPRVPGGTSAVKAATKAQYAQYLNALHMFKGEYGSYPEFFGDSSQFAVSDYQTSAQFIEALSGRSLKGEKVSAHGNRRGIFFYNFSDYELTKPNSSGLPQIIDRMGNTHFVICIDHDNDGFVEVPDGKETKLIRTRITAYSLDSDGEIGVMLWE